ncbi:reverse transcriptase domain-containing protein [Tanacetum coccineum]
MWGAAEISVGVDEYVEPDKEEWSVSGEKEGEQGEGGKRGKQQHTRSGKYGRGGKKKETEGGVEEKTLDARDLRRRLRFKHSHSISESLKRNPSVFSKIRRDRSESPRHRPEGRRDGGVFNRLGGKGKSVSAHSESCYHIHHSKRTDLAPKRRYHEGTSSRDMKAFSKSEDSRGGHWKSRSKKEKSSIKEDELSQPWVCEETDPFTPQDQLKKFQTAAKVEHWAMPTWCHMFNSTLNGSARVWFDDLPLESIDSYDDLKRAFLANYLQQKKCIKDPIEIHHIKKREGESREDFMQRFKAESRHVKGVLKCMRIYGFMHGITNPKLIKHLHENIPKSVDEIMRVTIAFLRGEVAASNQARRKALPSFSPDLEISFSVLGEEDGTEGPMIIVAEIGGHFIHRIYVDGGSASEILYEHCFNRLRPEVKSQMIPATTPLIGFSGEVIWPMRQILLLVKIGDLEHSTSTWMNFVVVRSPSPHNGIIRRPGVRKIQAVPSTIYGMLKFPVPAGVLTLRSSRIILLECIMVSRPKAQPSDVIQVAEERIKKAEDMTGVPQHLAEHHLNVREGCSSVRQKKRSQSPERNKAILIEVGKFVDAGIMKEVHYHSWLSNPVMVKTPGRQSIPKTNWQELGGNQHEAKSKEMHLWNIGRHVIRIQSEHQGDKGVQTRQITSVKGPILADFIVEHLEDDPLDTPMEAEEELLDPWTSFRIAQQMGIKSLQANVDSRLMANQVPRSENKKANALSKIASTSFAHLTRQVLVEELKEKSINEAEVLAVMDEEGDTWMTPIYNYLAKEELPADKKKARAIRRKSGRHVVINKVLYMKSYLGPWLRCVGPLQANYVLREIHEGSYSMHAGTRSVVAKAIRTGYYWSTMHADAKKLIRACQDCQVHRPVPRNPQQKLTPIMSLWPFYKWGIDIAGPFSEGPEKVISYNPAEIGMPTMRTAEVDIVQNDEALEINLDLLEERREQTANREAKSKAKMEKYYNFKIRDTSFKPRDLVYQNNDASHAKDSEKLSPKWEGPYEVTEALGNGAYKLRDRNGKHLLQT